MPPKKTTQNVLNSTQGNEITNVSSESSSLDDTQASTVALADRSSFSSLRDAIAARKENVGELYKSYRILSGPENMCLAELGRHLEALPQTLANVAFSGGAAFEKFNVEMGSYHYKLSAIKEAVLPRDDNEDVLLVIEEGLNLVDRWVNREFSPLNSLPGAMSMMIVFLDDVVVKMMLGSAVALKITTRIRSFMRDKSMIANQSAKKLHEWKPTKPGKKANGGGKGEKRKGSEDKASNEKPPAKKQY